MIKNFLKDSAIYSIGRFISLACGFLTIPIITKALSPDLYGLFDLLSLCLILLNLCVALQISQAIARFIGDVKDKQEKQEFVSTAFFFSIVMYLACGLIIFFNDEKISILLFGNDTYGNLILTVIPWLFLSGLFTFISNQFRWENKPKEQVILQSLQGILLLIFVYLFLIYGNPTILNLIYAYLISLFITVIVGLIFIHIHKIITLTFSKEKLETMILFSIPLVPAGLSVFAQNYIDRIMISQILDLKDLGIYSLAFKIASLLGLITGTFQLSIVPLIYKNHKNEAAPREFGDLARLYLFFILSITVAISGFISEIFHLFIGVEFHEAIGLVPLLLIAIGLQSFYIFAPGLSIANKTKYIAYISILGMIINVSLNYLFIKQWGIYGVASATIISAIVMCVINIIAGQIYYPVIFKYLTIVLALCLSCASIVVMNVYFLEYSLFTIAIKAVIITMTCVVLGYILVGNIIRDFLKS